LFVQFLATHAGGGGGGEPPLSTTGGTLHTPPLAHVCPPEQTLQLTPSTPQELTESPLVQLPFMQQPGHDASPQTGLASRASPESSEGSVEGPASADASSSSVASGAPTSGSGSDASSACIPSP
jgi:hypothetical protein